MSNNVVFDTHYTLDLSCHWIRKPFKEDRTVLDAVSSASEQAITC